MRKVVVLRLISDDPRLVEAAATLLMQSLPEDRRMFALGSRSDLVLFVDPPTDDPSPPPPPEPAL